MPKLYSKQSQKLSSEAAREISYCETNYRLQSHP